MMRAKKAFGNQLPFGCAAYCKCLGKNQAVFYNCLSSALGSIFGSFLQAFAQPNTSVWAPFYKTLLSRKSRPVR